MLKGVVQPLYPAPSAARVRIAWHERRTMTAIARVRVILTRSAGALPGVNTFYFIAPNSGAFTTGDVNDALTRVQAFMVGLQQMYTDGTTLQVSPDVDVLSDTDGRLLTQFTGTPHSELLGTGGSTPAPPVVAGLLTLHTLGIVNGHRLAGAMFVSPLSANVVQQGLWVPFTDTTFFDAAVAFAAADAGRPQLAVWSRPVKKSTPRTQIRLGSSWAVTVITAASKLAVLRSRRD